MASKNPSTPADMLMMALHQTEIDARNQSYAVATEAIKQSRFEAGDPKEVYKRWETIADLVYNKIRADMKSIFENKGA